MRRGTWRGRQRGRLPFSAWAAEWWETWAADDPSPTTLAATESWLAETAPGLGGSSSGLIHGIRAHAFIYNAVHSAEDFGTITTYLRMQGIVRPPYNVIISNVPGPRSTHYWNGARLLGVYPLSIPINGMALNITCSSYDGLMCFGLTGCRRTVPHLQRLLTHLDDELNDLEKATGA